MDEKTGLRAMYPIITIQSDLPATDLDAADNGDQRQSAQLTDQMGQAETVARAFDKWWDGNETSTVQVFDVQEQLAGSGSIH